MPGALIVVTRSADFGGSTTGSYVDIDANSYGVPAEAVGVWVEINNTFNGPRNADIRCNGSSDAFYYSGNYYGHQMALVGVDANGVFEIKQSSTDLNWYVSGYAVSPVTMFTNVVSKTVAGSGAYYDIDLTADTSATATMAFAMLSRSTSTIEDYNEVRCNGSTNNLYGDAVTCVSRAVATPLDADQVLEWKTQTNGDWSMKITGYYAGTKIVGNVNWIDRSLGSTGSYYDLTAANASARVALYRVTPNASMTGYTTHDFAMRPNGETGYDNYFGPCRGGNGYIPWHGWIVGCDANGVVELKIESTGTDCYEVGYVLDEPWAGSFVGISAPSTSVGVDVTTGTVVGV